MGNRAPKAEPSDQIKEDYSLCIHLQGLNDENQCGKEGSPLSSDKIVVAASCGMNHSLAILSSGECVSWGSNKQGQLGLLPDSYVSSYLYEPASVSPITFPKSIGNSYVISISAGMWHSVCVMNTGRVYAWGLGSDGQLGINPSSWGFETNSNEERFISKPTLVESLISEKITVASCGSTYTIVRTADSKVFAFGNGSEGVLGNGNTAKTYIPQEILALSGSKIRKIACGWSHCLALTTSGKVFTWGNQYKDIFDGSEPILYPTAVNELDNQHISDIACGDYHSCALSHRIPFGLFTWGSNGYGQLGDSYIKVGHVSMSPVQLRLEDVQSIFCGGLFTMAKLQDGSVYGWGCNRQNQIGNGVGKIVLEPHMVINSNNFLKKIVCGYSHVMFLGTSPISKKNLPALDVYAKENALKNDFDKHEFAKEVTSDRL